MTMILTTMAMRFSFLVQLSIKIFFVSAHSDICSPCKCSPLSHEGCIVMDCSSKNLSKLPPIIPISTCKLNLQNNLIETLVNDSFRELNNLSSLDISFNSIFELQGTCFSGLSKVEYLDLSGNNISFNATSETIFSPLQRLRSLNISNNSYPTYPRELLGPLGSLQILTMDGFQEPVVTGGEELHNLRYLSLSGFNGRCTIRHISSKMFLHLPMIQVLNLSNCGIYTTEPGALQILKHLHTLDLSDNTHLKFKGLVNVTNGLDKTNITKLVINQIVKRKTVGVIVGQAEVQQLQNSSLEVIEVSNNNIELFDKDIIHVLPKSLKRIIMRNNRLRYGDCLENVGNLTGLEFLDLSSDQVTHYLRFGVKVPGRKRRSLYMRQRENSLRLNKLSTHVRQHISKPYFSKDAVDFRIPPKLRKLVYANSLLEYYISEMHFAENDLNYIDLSSNILTRWFGPISGLEKVTHLNLSYNKADFVSPNFFPSFKSLVTLDISRNYLGIGSLRNLSYFRNLSSLKFLNISKNNIHVLRSTFVEGLHSLVQLDVSFNNIHYVDLNLKLTPQLTYFDLANNYLLWIGKKERLQMDELAEKHEIHVDLSWNMLSCDCDNLVFLFWLIKSRVRFRHFHNYTCMFESGYVIKFADPENALERLEETCRLYLPLALLTLSAVVLFTSLVLSGLCYRYRWNLIYFFYATKLKRKRNTRAGNDSYDFDAYVSYADVDFDFVRNTLNEVENMRGTRLYIRDRDSLPGAPIAENIIDGIRRSRRTVLVLSRAFLRKKWCRYELHMANMESVSTCRSVMVIIMLEDLPREHIPPEILYDVQNGRFVDYPHEGAGLDQFWRNLHVAIEV